MSSRLPFHVGFLGAGAQRWARSQLRGFAPYLPQQGERWLSAGNSVTGCLIGTFQDQVCRKFRRRTAVVSGAASVELWS